MDVICQMLSRQYNNDTAGEPVEITRAHLGILAGKQWDSPAL